MQGDILYIGAPLALLFIAAMTFVFVAVEIKKRRIDMRSIIGWFVTNIIYSIILIYVLIDAILQYFNVSSSINIFNWIAQDVFGVSFNHQEWLILLIFAFIGFTLFVTMMNMIKVQKLTQKVDELNREVAILNGKVNKTINFKATKIAINPKTLTEIRKELKLEVKAARAKRKANDKIKQLEITRITELKKIKKNKKSQ